MNYSNRTDTFIVAEQLELLNLVSFYINDVLGSFLFSMGIIFNLLSFTYFQLSRSFKDTSMRHYFSVISITDSFRLAEWLFAFLVDKKMLYINNAFCNKYLFIVLTSGHISIWLLVFLSIERYIILQFPFHGKRIFTTRNSLRMMCAVILLLTLFDVPYLISDFIKQIYVNYELHLVMCITNPEYNKYMFVNNVLVYALVPFFLLLIFNGLLILLLARQKSQFMNVIQSGNTSINAKRERQFKETTILLIVVTFFLLVTVSPRYIVQMIFTLTKYSGLNKIIVAKCLNVLEMFNFTFNFIFYIICSKTSRNELYLIVYYLFYWKWSDRSKKIKICNHAEHNQELISSKNSILVTNSRSFRGSNNNICLIQNKIGKKSDSNIFSYFKRKSRLKIYCFLEHAARIKTTGSFARSNINASLINNNIINNLLNDSSIVSQKQSSLNFDSQVSFDSSRRKRIFFLGKKNGAIVGRKKNFSDSFESTRSNLINQRLFKSDQSSQMVDQSFASIHSVKQSLSLIGAFNSSTDQS
ncbi:FMRFamide receptor-like [Brachionus plicatilis]|uniref:FMRFamide receptor-like n=1 Tax=Brachionus plicatilis TaxID=10195 RepID=A0A3M7SZ48_BRAPC|nr:FMRFamide receptor-like [Brachionus plicatilis]